MKLLLLVSTLGLMMASPAFAASLLYSSSSNRSNGVPLQGATFSGSKYIFVTGVTGPVKFYLDGVLKHTEYGTPWDYAGGTSTAANRASFTTGNHTMKVVHAGGSLSASFSVTSTTTTTPTTPTTTTPTTTPTTPTTPTTTAPPSGAQMHVSPTGSDTASGSSTAPKKTIGAAVRALVNGGTVLVRPGTYTPFADSTLRTADKAVLVQGTGDTRPVIRASTLGSDAVNFTGAHYLTLSGFRIRGRVNITERPYLSGKPYQTSRGVTLHRNDISTNTLSYCVRIRSGAQNTKVIENWIHDCHSGITGPNYADNGNVVRGLLIQRNRLERFFQDAMQFADWHDVTFDSNYAHSATATDSTHNDILQFTGNARNIRITNNYFTHSEHQIMLIQPAFGAIDNVLVQNNVIANGGAVSVQSQSSTNVRFIHNTLWKSRWHGLWVRKSTTGSTLVTHDTIVANNILHGLAYGEGATASTYSNFVRCDAGSSACSQTLRGTDPGFGSISNNLYNLVAGSEVIGRGNASYTTGTDLLGNDRTGVDLGALDSDSPAPNLSSWPIPPLQYGTQDITPKVKWVW